MADRKETLDSSLDKIMNRLRARLFNHFEAMDLNNDQLKAHKQVVKDITSFAWDDLNNLINDKKEK